MANKIITKKLTPSYYRSFRVFVLYPFKHYEYVTNCFKHDFEIPEQIIMYQIKNNLEIS